jgi:long-chain fatty acid adenylase/transferase FadD26
LPDRRSGLRRVRGAADDVGTDVLVTTRAARLEMSERFGTAAELAGLCWVEIDTETAGRCAAGAAGLPEADPDGLALLQYTSGSTGDPRGVMVTHRNLCRNAAELDELWPLGNDGRIVSWLPMFHDMGFLFGVVLPLWAGIPAYLMAPEAFIRRPARWLEAISRYRGTHSAGPDFAYEMCVRSTAASRPAGLDLSSWRVAVNGAEPVQSATLRRFASSFAVYGLDPRALCPGYGLAENTLKVSGSAGDEPPRSLPVSRDALQMGRIAIREPGEPGSVEVVSCGAPHSSTQVRIVDPRTGFTCAPDVVGEIWVRGPCVAEGYWGKTAQTAAVFRARLADGDPAECYLRTGDLGFCYDGDLFVTGRLEDLIVHRGGSHYPQDIERTVQGLFSGLHPAAAAAFSVPGEETDQLVIVVEAGGRPLSQAPPDELTAEIAAAVRAGHGIDPHDVVLVRRGALPRTSSGKVRHQACRRAYAAGSLARLGSARSALI